MRVRVRVRARWYCRCHGGTGFGVSPGCLGAWLITRLLVVDLPCSILNYQSVAKGKADMYREKLQLKT